MSKTRLVCSFCAKTTKQVAKLIAGPAAYICDEDVSRAEKSHRPAAAHERCSFCEKTELEWVHGQLGRAMICSECVKLCREVIDEDLSETDFSRAEEAKPQKKTKSASARIAAALSSIPVEGARCPSCRAVLAESARTQLLDVAGDGDGAAKVLFLYCSNCGHTLDDVMLPTE